MLVEQEHTDYTTLGTTATYVLSDADLNDVATDFIDGSVIYLDGTASSVLREDSVLDSCKSIRPVLKFNKDLTKELKTKKVMLGMYPQYVVDLEKQIKIEKNFKYKKLLLTGNSYTFPNGRSYEYEYNGERFVRVINNSNCPVVLSNGLIYHKDWYAWVKVEPVIWIVKENMLVSSKGLLSGIPFNNSQEFASMKSKFKEGDWYKIEGYTKNDNYAKIKNLKAILVLCA